MSRIISDIQQVFNQYLFNKCLVWVPPPLWQEVKRTKEPLDESERGELNSWLKAQHQKTEIMVSGPITPWQIDGETWKQWQTLFLGAPKSLKMVTAAMKLKDTYSLEENL